jgi:N utilization substance protein A
MDVILWDESPENLIANALQPAHIEQVILHPAEHRATVIVKKDQLCFVAGSKDNNRSLFGSGDDNRELASRLCGWHLTVVVQQA